MKNLFPVALLSISYLFTALPCLPHDKIPDRTARLQEVDLVYYSYFFSDNITVHINTKNCRPFHQIKNGMRSQVLRCREQIKLLLPHYTIVRWQKMQKENGYISLTVYAFGIINRQAFITDIKPVNRAVRVSDTTDHGAMVTGKLIRHVKNTAEYTFKNLYSNHISNIHSTAEHPFYVVGAKAFIPVSKVSSHDRLLTSRGQQVKLLCQHESHDNCGNSDNREQIVTVYNLLIHVKHVYFAGKDNILVHNGCNTTTYDRLYESVLKDMSESKTAMLCSLAGYLRRNLKGFTETGKKYASQIIIKLYHEAERIDALGVNLTIRDIFYADGKFGPHLTAEEIWDMYPEFQGKIEEHSDGITLPFSIPMAAINDFPFYGCKQQLLYKWYSYMSPPGKTTIKTLKSLQELAWSHLDKVHQERVRILRFKRLIDVAANGVRVHILPETITLSWGPAKGGERITELP